MTYLIDYFSFTSKIHNNGTLIHDLGLESIDQWQTTKGNYGYSHCSFYGGMRLYFGKDDESVFFSMSGQGCRTFETYSSIEWCNLFEMVTADEESFNVTRIDVACDEKENILNIDKIYKFTEKEQFSSRFRWYLCNKGSEGVSVVLGSPQSNIRIRIYDKNAERGFTEGHWIRCELQLRDELAFSIVQNLLKMSTGSCFVGVLNNYFRYIKNDHTRKENCSTVSWWDDFINSAEKLKIYKKVGIEYNLSNLEHFIEKQVGNSLLTYLECCGGDISSLVELISKRKGKLSLKQKTLVNDILRSDKLKENNRKEEGQMPKECQECMHHECFDCEFLFNAYEPLPSWQPSETQITI